MGYIGIMENKMETTKMDYILTSDRVLLFF